MIENASMSHRLSTDDVRLWLADIGESDVEVEKSCRLLSSDEQVRAARFHFQKDRNRFILCRGILRTLLGGYLKTNPSRLIFGYTDKGKPYLENPPGDPISFNLSHSEDWALFAFCRKGPIGVDLEQLRPIPDALNIAESFFSDREKHYLRGLRNGEADKAFLVLWTRKEAYLKACGMGLSRPLSEIEILAENEADAPILQIPGNPSEAEGWTVRTLSPSPDLIAGVAVEIIQPKISLAEWAGD